MIKHWVAAFFVFCAGHAHALAAEWHWDVFGTGGYSGQISFTDDQGSPLNYQRYSTGSPSLFGSTSVQSPVTVIAGADIKIDIVRAGVAQTKKVCNAPAVWKVYLVPTTACDSGRAGNIGGFHAWADTLTATQYTPRVAVYVMGSGWRPVAAGHACGSMQSTQVCE